MCFLRPDPPVAGRPVRKAPDTAAVDRACVDSEGCAQSVREVLVEKEASKDSRNGGLEALVLRESCLEICGTPETALNATGNGGIQLSRGRCVEFQRRRGCA